MSSNSMLLYTSISQWALFLGIALIIFGWVEKRNVFQLSGLIVFLALGVFGLWIVLTNDIPPRQPGELKITKVAKAMAYFKGTAYFMVLAAVSLVLEAFKVKRRKYLVYAIVLFAMMLFFMVFHIQQMSS